MNRAYSCVAFFGGLFCVLLLDAGAVQLPVGVRRVVAWLSLNLGYSAPLFGLALLFVTHNMACLLGELGKEKSCSSRIFHLEHRVDIGISLLFGIGVLFTAIGIRDALTAAIHGEAAAKNGGDVLTLLVNGGILSAMTTTVVGGALGYSLRVIKVLATGEKLERVHARTMGEGLQKQEALLRRISNQLATIGGLKTRDRG